MPRIRLDELARRWVPGTGPPGIERLRSGLVNDSYRVSRDGGCYLLRVAAPDGDGLGVDRRWECAVLEAAAAAGIAPTVKCCDPAAGILVADWLSGSALSADELRLPSNIEAMARLLHRVHALSIPQPARFRDPRAWIALYSDALAGCTAEHAPRSLELRSAANAHLEDLAQLQPSLRVLCHSDLHRLNVLIGERSVLLDWEFAHVSDAFWDLAGWAANNDWTEREADQLLAAYLRRPPQAAERSRLRTWMWLYDYVCLLWSEVYASQRTSAQSREVLARAEIVAGRLRQIGWPT